jgi:hypothetical protein
MTINVHIEEGDSIEGDWDEKDKAFSIKVYRNRVNISAKNVQVTTFYDRTKKPKILNKIEFERSSRFTVRQSELLKQYEQVWAIDTNMKVLFNQAAHVSAITVCSTDGREDYFPVIAIIFGKTKNNPELYGWRKFIEFVQTSELYNQAHRYALIIDSELSNLPEFNNKKLAIHGGFYLPENWNLIYATSDSGKEYIINKLISTSDKASSLVLKKISDRQSNAKYWNIIDDEEQHQPIFLPLAEPQG